MPCRSCNVPDVTGFSAFKYACGKGHMEIIRLFLDEGDIQDEDGIMTSLILAAKNAHDNVVKVSRGRMDETGARMSMLFCFI